MSKFILNLLLQISKALVYSKIKFYSEKNFSFTLNPIGPAASRPIQPFGPAATHFFLFSTGHFSPPSPLGLGLLAGPAHPHGPTVVFFLLTALAEHHLFLLPACAAAAIEAPCTPSFHH
jgi:hypothetical protein